MTTTTSEVPLMPRQLNSISKCLITYFEIFPPQAALPFRTGYINVEAELKFLM